MASWRNRNAGGVIQPLLQGLGWGGEVLVHLEALVQAKRVCPPPPLCSVRPLVPPACEGRRFTAPRSDADLLLEATDTPETVSHQLVQHPCGPVKLTPKMSQHSDPWLESSCAPCWPAVCQICPSLPCVGVSTATVSLCVSPCSCVRLCLVL